MGVPSVNIGTRQSDRERGPNVLDVIHDKKKICNSIIKQVGKKFKKSFIYGSGDAGEKIAEIISKSNFRINKKLNYLIK